MEFRVDSSAEKAFLWVRLVLAWRDLAVAVLDQAPYLLAVLEERSAALLLVPAVELELGIVVVVAAAVVAVAERDASSVVESAEH